MFGKEDEDILHYFVDTAFPTEKEATDVMGYISCNDGVKQNQVYSALNQKKFRLDKAIYFLKNEGVIMKKGNYIMPSRNPSFTIKKTMRLLLLLCVTEVLEIRNAEKKISRHSLFFQ